MRRNMKSAAVSAATLKRQIPDVAIVAGDLYGIDFRKGVARCLFPQNHSHGDRDPSLRHDRKKDRLCVTTERIGNVLRHPLGRIADYRTSPIRSIIGSDLQAQGLPVGWWCFSSPCRRRPARDGPSASPRQSINAAPYAEGSKRARWEESPDADESSLLISQAQKCGMLLSGFLKARLHEAKRAPQWVGFDSDSHLRRICIRARRYSGPWPNH